MTEEQERRPSMEEHKPAHDKPEKVKGDHLSKNKKLFEKKSLLQDEWCNFCSKPDAFVCAWFCGCCVHGVNCMMSEQDQSKKILDCVLAIFCSCCLCSLFRSNHQKSMGVDDDGFIWNCLMHFSCCISPCSLTQEYRGLVRWKKATDEKFKSSYKKKSMWWDVALQMLK